MSAWHVFSTHWMVCRSSWRPTEGPCEMAGLGLTVWRAGGESQCVWACPLQQTHCCCLYSAEQKEEREKYTPRQGGARWVVHRGVGACIQCVSKCLCVCFWVNSSAQNNIKSLFIQSQTALHFCLKDCQQQQQLPEMHGYIFFFVARRLVITQLY